VCEAPVAKFSGVEYDVRGNMPAMRAYASDPPPSRTFELVISSLKSIYSA
jgi:hypothetical protein